MAKLTRALAAALLAWLIIGTDVLPPRIGGEAQVKAQAPPYSTPPTLQAFQAGVTTPNGLTLPYTIGIVYVGGANQIIQPGSVVLADNQNNCQSPQYPACNIVYWSGQGTALSATTSPQLAFGAGLAIVGFVTTAGGAITNVATMLQASEVSDNLIPSGSTVGAGGFRLPVCNLLLKLPGVNCQASTGSLSGY